MRELLTVPNPILRRKCIPVEVVDSEVRRLAKELRELMGVKHRGLILIGVTAPQVGVPIRLFVYRVNPYSDVPDIRTVINPEVVYAKDKAKLEETCLSIPGKKYLVDRYRLVKIRGMGLDGRYHSFKGRGLVAQTFQHEINHLDGVLIDSIGELIAGGE